MQTRPAFMPLWGLPLACAAIASLTHAAAMAQLHVPEAVQLDPPYKVVITANRTVQPLADVLADTAVITGEQIRTSGAANIADLLQRQPGVELSRSGGPGTQTSLFLRGADNRFTAVYVDGVRVDTQATGGPPWEAISLAQVERIEIVRGPAAAVYGSDAVAGVIQIFTRRGEGPAQPFVGLSLGTRHGWRAETGVSGSVSDFDYALGAGREGSRGFNAMPTGNPDRDGWRQDTANARLGWQLDATHRIELTGTYTDMDARYDGFDPSADERGLNHLSTVGLNWAARWNNHYSSRVSLSQSNHRYADEPSAYTSKTRLRNVLWHNEWRQGEHVLSADLERRDDHLDNEPIREGRHQNGLALGYGYHGSRHSLQINVRHDRDSQFGGQTTASVAYGIRFAPEWRATVSAATAFRAPTLYRTQFALSGLEPEKSRNLEAGLHWSRNQSGVDLVLYQNRIRNLIDWDTLCPPPLSGGCYVNIGRANLRGASLSAQHTLSTVNLGGSLDWQQPTNTNTGMLLARRARRQLKLNADTRVADWTLGVEWQLASHRLDYFISSIPPVRLAGYGVFNVYASTTLARDWDLLLRVDNVANRHYELTSGYATPPARALALLRWTPH